MVFPVPVGLSSMESFPSLTASITTSEISVTLLHVLELGIVGLEWEVDLVVKYLDFSLFAC